MSPGLAFLPMKHVIFKPLLSCASNRVIIYNENTHSKTIRFDPCDRAHTHGISMGGRYTYRPSTFAVKLNTECGFDWRVSEFLVGTLHPLLNLRIEVSLHLRRIAEPCSLTIPFRKQSAANEDQKSDLWHTIWKDL